MGFLGESYHAQLRWRIDFRGRQSFFRTCYEDSNVCIFWVHGGAMIAKEFAKTQKPPNVLVSAATQVEKIPSQEHTLQVLWFMMLFLLGAVVCFQVCLNSLYYIYYIHYCISIYIIISSYKSLYHYIIIYHCICWWTPIIPFSPSRISSRSKVSPLGGGPWFWKRWPKLQVNGPGLGPLITSYK